ncbi:hypothetical protein SAMN05216511_0665 [Streptomyces sp. KS_16]|nr:hypothetical protein BX261_6584 [Streptomyces sp. 2321.6]SDQ82480.1 hypothetical protein SAMN05216511_0665 [Streptomyces sp. KS_16]SEE00168.1 hypothetical protein SAMN05428940_6612 [Streptomyces sp. 2133.1]
MLRAAFPENHRAERRVVKTNQRRDRDSPSEERTKTLPLNNQIPQPK